MTEVRSADRSGEGLLLVLKPGEEGEEWSRAHITGLCCSVWLVV